MATNVLGVHALSLTGEVSREAIRYAATTAAAAGFGLLELSLHNLEDFDVRGSREDFQQLGLQAVGSRGLHSNADISSTDTAVVARGTDLLRNSIDTIANLGGQLLTGALYSAFRKYPSPLTVTGRANAIAALRDLSTHAKERGVTLGLEVCNRYETNVVNTAAQAVQLADDIGADNIIVHLDSYHMNIEEDDFARPIATARERLGYVHIGENHRGYLGSGHIDFGALFHALADISYGGPVTFESFSSAIVAEPLSSDLAIWRNLWDDGHDLVHHAQRFMADGLGAGHSR